MLSILNIKLGKVQVRPSVLLQRGQKLPLVPCLWAPPRCVSGARLFRAPTGQVDAHPTQLTARLPRAAKTSLVLPYTLLQRPVLPLNEASQELLIAAAHWVPAASETDHRFSF